MKDRLEEFVKKNRAAFDDQEPPTGLWTNIENDLKLAPRQSWWNTLAVWRAAAILFMALSVGLFFWRSAPPVKKVDRVAMREFNDVEAFYTKQISEKVELIDDLKAPEGEEGFTQDFQQLEAMYQVLKEEMRTRPTQKVKDALVLNLLVRIDLLNQQLHRLEQSDKAAAKKEAAKGSSV